MTEPVSLGLAVAFAAGLLSFLSPCVLPLVPSYIGFLTGMSLPEMTARRRAALGHALLFVLGFSVVFVLLGSVSAPPSARRSPSFGLLRGATQSEVRRWLRLLEVAGALEQYDTDDGFRLLRVVQSAEVPRISTRGRAGHDPPSPADEGLFDRLRAWRLERARADEVPAFVVLHDTTLRALAAAKPRSHADLAAVNGFGPAKLERYGADVLALIASAAA